MTEFKIKIKSIMGGMSPLASIGSDDQYTNGFGFDPDQPSTAFQDGGLLVPNTYNDFSGVEVGTDKPMWLLNEPKGATELFYAYTTGGKLISYSTSFASETTKVTVSGGNGSGGVYYNNYFYLMEAADVTRWGPLDGTAAEGANVWTGATLGSQTALTNTTYPSIGGVALPNHAGHVHTDGALYFCDYINGQGIIHKIKTKKVTEEGDTNDGSQYNVLDLPFGYAPIDIESWGLDLAILAFPVTSHTSLRAGKAALFLWNPTETKTFYAQINLQDDLATAILNNNGSLYTWSGSQTLGHRVSQYTGGYTFEQLAYVVSGELPFPGGVDSLGPRIFWGSHTPSPARGDVIYSLGYKHSESNALHAPIATSSPGSGTITCITRARSDSFGNTDLVAGWYNGSQGGIDRRTGNATPAVYRSLAYQIGEPYTINRVIVPLDRKLDSNMEITVTLFESKDLAQVTPATKDGKVIGTINNTNFTKSERYIVFNKVDYKGVNDLMIELKWTSNSTSVLGVRLPIIIEGETREPGNV